MTVEIDITKQKKWFANTNKQLVFPIYEDDEETPIGISMVGWNCEFIFKRDIDDADADALIFKSGGSVFLGTDPISGIPAWFVDIQPEDTNTIAFDENQTVITGKYDLVRVDPGTRIKLATGRAKLRRSVDAE